MESQKLCDQSCSQCPHDTDPITSPNLVCRLVFDSTPVKPVEDVMIQVRDPITNQIFSLNLSYILENM